MRRKPPFPLGTVAVYLATALAAWIVAGLIVWGLT